MRHFSRLYLRNLRLSKGYSLEMTRRLMEARTGRKVSRSAICHWELGKSRPSLESLLGLAEVFSVPVDYFFEPRTNYLFDELVSLGIEDKYDPFRNQTPGPGSRNRRSRPISPNETPAPPEPGADAHNGRF